MARAVYPLTYPHLKSRIVELDRTQTDLAAEIGCSPTSITQIIRGRMRPSAGMRSRLAAALRCTEADLFGDSEVAA